jgi:iron complex outermembrane receptor protein
VRAEASFFYYSLKDFVFLAPTGEIEDGLIAADYAQADANYRGAEGRLDVGLHQNLWLNLLVDGVHAEITDDNTPLPRIPPVRGRIGFDGRYKGLSVRPEVVLANHQDRVFPTETNTAGFAVLNLSGSYTIVRPHSMHMFSATLFNTGDRLYRNHLSFIKVFAPEIGRGARVAYTIRFF